MKRKIKNTITKIIGKILPFSCYRTSYSQAGEDVVIDFLMQGVDLNRPVYLELGTNNPDLGNNTFLFYSRGARGVLVEADETLVPKIKKIRPKDKLINIGVGLSTQKNADFFIFENDGLNTFSEEEANFREKNGISKIKKIVKVELRTINEIIAENFDPYPDFLSIDIEGLDLPVLESLDFDKYPIPIICAETCDYSETHIKEKNYEIEKFLKTKGYFVYADTYINTIFVNRKWFNSASKINVSKNILRQSQ